MLSIYVILYNELDLFNTRCDMISYNKLWKLLIDRGMNKSDLRKLVGMSSGSLAKLGKNEPVSMDIILRICQKLNCDIADIMEVTESTEKTMQ